MKCCVPLCTNTGEDHPITVPVQDGQKWVTFNRLPTTASQRAVWLEMLGLIESDLPPDAVVCSDHFKRNDFTVMNDEVVKLNKDSIPLQFCVICLASGHSKMYPMNKNYLEKAYSTMTGIAVSYIRDKINTQPRVCVECAQRLVNCDKFRNKSLRAYKSLMQILGNDKVLTLHNLKSINRVGKLLISNIEKHTFEPDHCDLYVNNNHEEITILKEEYSSDIKRNIDMKRVKYGRNGGTDFNVLDASKSKDFQNDVHTTNDINNDNKSFYNEIKIANIINYDVQVKNTNINNDDNTNYSDAELRVDDIIINSDATNVTNNENVLIISDSEDEDDIKHDIDNDIDNDINNDIDIDNDIDNDIDIDDDVEDGFADDLNICHKNGISSNYVKLVNSLKDSLKYENKSVNRVDLSNIIFVKHSHPTITYKDLTPRIDRTNKNAQFQRVYSKTKPKNINAQTITTNNQNELESFKERKENIKLNNCPSDVFQETQNGDKVLNNIKQQITKSNNKRYCRVLAPKKNGRQLSSKIKLVRVRVPKPKREKIPKPRGSKTKQTSITKMFTKTVLSYEDQLADIQNRQYTENYKSYPYKCNICFTGRWSLTTYNRHMDKHTDKYGKFECAVCGLRKKTRRGLVTHVNMHVERYSCKLCKYVTSSTMLRTHAQWHNGLAFKCKHCGTMFSKRISYLSHLRIKHPSDCVCPLCGFSFISDNGVKAHINLIHPSEDVENLSGPSCAQCNVRFSTEAAYDTHMSVSPKHVSSGVARRNEFQPGPLGRVRKARRRQDASSVGAPVLCEVCGKTIQGPWFLQKHLDRHAGLTHKCDLCDKSYRHKISLKHHVKAAHSGGLKYHACSVCHRQFSFHANMYRHMQTHYPTKRTWYTCDICNKSFTTLGAKNNHIAHVHNNVPWPKRHRVQRRARKRKYSEEHSDSHDASE